MSSRNKRYAVDKDQVIEHRVRVAMDGSGPMTHREVAERIGEPTWDVLRVINRLRKNGEITRKNAAQPVYYELNSF